jgi:hypothetical protein
VISRNRHRIRNIAVSGDETTDRRVDDVAQGGLAFASEGGHETKTDCDRLRWHLDRGL